MLCPHAVPKASPLHPPPPSSPHFLPSFLYKKSAQNFLNNRQIFSPQHKTHLSLPITSFMTGTPSKTLGSVHRIN